MVKSSWPDPPASRRRVQKKPKNAAAVALGTLGGLKGGASRAAKLSPQRRSEIARNAAQTRWRMNKMENSTVGAFERITESDLILPALRIMAESEEGFVSTAELIMRLQDVFQPVGKDAEIIQNRSDTYFSQKVRNLISHRHAPTSFILQGYAEYSDEANGLKITDKGRALIRQFGGHP